MRIYCYFCLRINNISRRNNLTVYCHIFGINCRIFLCDTLATYRIICNRRSISDICNSLCLCLRTCNNRLRLNIICWRFMAYYNRNFFVFLGILQCFEPTGFAYRNSLAIVISNNERIAETKSPYLRQILTSRNIPVIFARHITDNIRIRNLLGKYQRQAIKIRHPILYICGNYLNSIVQSHVNLGLLENSVRIGREA